jgi:hypothetical protein
MRKEDFVKRTVLFTVLFLTLGLGGAWASPIQGTTNPNTFTQDSINWCQFGCVGAGETTPQPWKSIDGATGTIGLVNGGFQGFYSFQEAACCTGTNWVGNFSSGMGVIYNGYQFGCALPGVGCQPAGIKIAFDSAVEGVGAYIQGTNHGPFSATITLFGQNGNSLGSFSAGGVSDTQQGTALFIGASSAVPIFAAQFDANSAGNPSDPNCLAGCEDFAIGTVKFGSPIPEPSSLLLFTSSALGVAGVIRRRFRGVH